MNWIPLTWLSFQVLIRSDHAEKTNHAYDNWNPIAQETFQDAVKAAHDRMSMVAEIWIKMHPRYEGPPVQLRIHRQKLLFFWCQTSEMVLLNWTPGGLPKMCDGLCQLCSASMNVNRLRLILSLGPLWQMPNVSIEAKSDDRQSTETRQVWTVFCLSWMFPN